MCNSFSNKISCMKNKFFLLIVFSGFFVSMLFCQDSEISNIETKDWAKYKTVEGVKILYKKEECNDYHNGTFKEYVFFKFVNTNDYSVEVSYNLKLNYGGASNSIDSESQLSVSLNSLQTLESTCSENRELNIFSKFLNYDLSELESFEFLNIRVLIVKVP
jgi:hypothetical protein